MKLAVMWKHIWPGNCALLFYLSAVLLPFLFAPKAHTTVLYNKRRPISASYLSSLRALCIWAKSTQVRWCRVVLTNDSMCRQACYWTRYQPYKELNSKWEWECYNSEYCTLVAIPYIDVLVSKIKGHFSEGAVKSLSHHPSLIQLHFQRKNWLFPSMERKKYKRWSTSMEKK